jgi:hypothetical protein
MTPKDKAKELVYKYQYLVNTWDCYNDESLEMIYRLPDMKQCALIAVDLAIECNDFHLNFLQEVKQEIEKL